MSMFRLFKTLVIATSVILILFISRELYFWYLYLSNLSIWSGYAYIILAFSAIFYFIVWPVIRVFALPSFGNPEASNNVRTQKRALLRRAKLLKISSSQLSSRTVDEIENVLKHKLTAKNKKAAEIRHKYVNTAFITTTVSQSAVIDLYVVLSCSFKVMLETFRIYGGRVAVKDVFHIIRHIVASGALGASEAAEFGGEQLVQLATKSGRKIPVLNLVAESLSDGMVNAILVCRIAMLTENYCTIALVQEKTTWYPTMKAVVDSTKSITGGALQLLQNGIGKGGKYVGDLLNDVYQTLVRKVSFSKTKR